MSIVFSVILALAQAPSQASAGTLVIINFESVDFDTTSGYPFIGLNNRTLVPFRQTLESFGAQVEWEGGTRTAIASKDGIRVEVPIGAKYILKDGQRIANDWKNTKNVCIHL